MFLECSNWLDSRNSQNPKIIFLLRNKSMAAYQTDMKFLFSYFNKPYRKQKQFHEITSYHLISCDQEKFYDKRNEIFRKGSYRTLYSHNTLILLVTFILHYMYFYIKISNNLYILVHCHHYNVKKKLLF